MNVSWALQCNFDCKLTFQNKIKIKTKLILKKERFKLKYFKNFKIGKKSKMFLKKGLKNLIEKSQK